jgi:hypothetical protein
MSKRTSAYGAFAGMAQDFCLLLETMDATQPEELVKVRQILASLYAFALLLPPVRSRERLNLKLEPLWGRRRALHDRLDQDLPVNEFRCVFNSLAPEEAPCTGTLADAFADIWYDLKAGLEGLERFPEEQHKSIWWQWRFDFEAHWGKHAIEALNALHDYAGTGDA